MSPFVAKALEAVSTVLGEIQDARLRERARRELLAELARARIARAAAKRRARP